MVSSVGGFVTPARECVCECVREKVSMREPGLKLPAHVHVRKEKRDEERNEDEIGMSEKYNRREEGEGRDFMRAAQSKDSTWNG